jgi:hypothetical protein
LGDKWEHKWEPTNSEKLVKSPLPYDESRRIFCKENIDNGQFDAVLTIVFGVLRNAEMKEERKKWFEMVKAYLDVLHYICLSRDYVDGELQLLENACDRFSELLLFHCGGVSTVTNYFHDIIAKHVVQQSYEWGCLWRFRNKGVEAFNAVLSRYVPRKIICLTLENYNLKFKTFCRTTVRRRNCFSNLGGAKRGKNGAVKTKFLPIESIGKWCCRTGGWQTRVADEVFIQDHYLCKSENVKWDSVTSSHIILDLGEQDDDEYDMDPEWNPSLEEYAAFSDEEDYLGGR